jgi:NADPH:quinone reductase-like Zn-dependent oxidoreductase
MKAIVYREYGGPEVLRVEEVETLRPGTGEVLVRVRAAALNPYDWHFMRGLPYPLRLMAGIGKPKVTRLGFDVAGVVEAIGAGVTKFAAGDAVFGGCSGKHAGSLAEFACTGEKDLVPKPESVTFEQAAATPLAALTALQGLRKGRIAAGHAVLVNGAAGGVGSFAVQIAKAMGATVTGVCSTKNVEALRSIGADRVIDYRREDFAAGVERYDQIYDAVGNRSLAECRRMLKPNGVLVMAGGEAGNWMAGAIARSFGAMALSWFGGREMVGMLAQGSAEDLSVVAGLMKAGKVVPFIDRTYALGEAGEAIRYLEGRHARGKVVVAVG